MAKTHYETLGVSIRATASEIRASYRKVVLKHHPDRSPSKDSERILSAAMEAFEVLSDPERKLHYDRLLEVERRQKVEAARPQPTPRAEPQAPRNNARPDPRVERELIAVQLKRLTDLFGKGKYVEAEKIAREILASDMRQAVPYAILGDLARMRGNLNEASKMYAYAVQMDPRNPMYQRRHEELLDAVMPTISEGPKAAVGASKGFPAVVGMGLVSCAAIYIALSKEAPVVPGLKLISTWTTGLMVMLFLSGVATGSSMALSGLLDRFSSAAMTTIGRASPTVALGFVAVVNFWAAVLIYALIGVSQRTFSYSTTRIVTVVGAVTIGMSIAASVSGTIHPGEVLVWGGNLVYLGSLCGWMVADSFRT